MANTKISELPTATANVADAFVIVSGLRIIFFESIFKPLDKRESGGRRICLTSTSITELNDAPIIIPIAISIILPFTANSLNSLNRTNLHIGDVQSGKTLTMAAAIALAKPPVVSAAAKIVLRVVGSLYVPFFISIPLGITSSRLSLTPSFASTSACKSEKTIF